MALEFGYTNHLRWVYGVRDFLLRQLSNFPGMSSSRSEPGDSNTMPGLDEN